jgi:hypothetical protein
VRRCRDRRIAADPDVYRLPPGYLKVNDPDRPSERLVVLAAHPRRMVFIALADRAAREG